MRRLAVGVGRHGDGASGVGEGASVVAETSHADSISVGTTDRRYPRELASQSRSRDCPRDRLDHFGPGQRAVGVSTLALRGQSDHGGQRLGTEVGEERQPPRVVDRQVVGPRMQLDREGDLRPCAEDRREDVGHRQDPGADRAGLPAEAPGGERQDHVLDVGHDHERGQTFGRRERVVEPHHEVAGVERHPGDVRIEAIEEGQQLARRSGRRGSRCASRIPQRLSRGVRPRITSSDASTCESQVTSVRNRSWRSPMYARAWRHPSAARASTWGARDSAISRAETGGPAPGIGGPGWARGSRPRCTGPAPRPAGGNRPGLAASSDSSIDAAFRNWTPSKR